jgi:hypothetical protein
MAKPDFDLGDDAFIDAKFGPWANFTKRQRQAIREGKNIRAMHSGPEDVGKAVGLVTASPATHLTDPEQRLGLLEALTRYPYPETGRPW